ncbi:MAG: hypothetical protein NVSMB29_02450 [Candidatus Dormibacteria bacterium]
MVITSLQVLGQTLLGFKVSVAQILVTVAVCAIVELGVTFHRRGMIIWPASALLTGNSVAFILRASGTRHGDWWSLNGVHWFVLAALLSLLSKYLIRLGGRHIFNPSNIGLVITLLVVGATGVFPQYLWWGPIDVPVALALGVIFAGAAWLLRPLVMVSMAVAFLGTFAALVGVFAATGRSFYAIWHSGPISGGEYWLLICTSPELLIFVFFMMSDPMTAPRARLGRAIYGAATAVVGAALLFFQSTEFGIKVSILSSLTVVCALVPLINHVSGLVERHGEGRVAPQTSGPTSLRIGERLAAATLSPALVAVVGIAVAAPVDTMALASNQQVLLIEQGLSGSTNPQ